MAEARIVVLTPVRDEGWILERFLIATSEFADHILILDQRSEDDSRTICSRFPKVTVLENPRVDYEEAARTRLLLEEARSRFGLGNVLIALDADEIITGDCLHSSSWMAFRQMKQGTVICFEKPEMLPQPPRQVSSSYWFPLGLVDDGSRHDGRLIHSARIPFRPDSMRYYAGDIKIMHFARLRLIEFAVRQAYYCMVENVNRSKGHRARSIYYSPHFFLRFWDEETKPCPAEWFSWYKSKGIDLWSYRTERFNSFHRRALNLFAEHGTSRFCWDDIWWENWEAARQHFTAAGVSGLPVGPLREPASPVKLASKLLVRFYWLIGILGKWSRYFIINRNQAFLNFR